jgi:hypothetical protein
MKVLFLTLICAIALATTVVAQPDIKLKIGAKLPHKYLPGEEEEERRIATHPSQSRPFIEKTITTSFDKVSLR